MILIKKRKISFIELIVLFLFLVAIAFFAFLFFRKSVNITVVVKIGSDSVRWNGGATSPWFSQFFYPGMKEQDGLGRTTAEVLEVKSIDTSPTDKSIYTTIKLKVTYNRSSNQYVFRGKPVLIGSTVRLYLDKVLVDGLITQVEGVKDLRENANLKINAQIIEENPAFPETYGTKEYIATAIPEGQEIKNDQGEVIITVLSRRIQNAQKVVTTGDGRVFIQEHPLKKSVTYTLKVKATRIYSRYYIFDDVPLNIGSTIPLITNTAALYPEITQILPDTEE